MKKYVKTIIIVSVLALMCIGYFFYLSNRKSTKDATDKSVGNQEVAALTTKDIDKNYPESPKEVVKLYARITKAYYKTSLTDEQIEALGTNARKLFDIGPAIQITASHNPGEYNGFKMCIKKEEVRHKVMGPSSFFN